MIDTLTEFLSQPTASTLGFVGIAVLYFSIAIFDRKSSGLRRVVKMAYIVAGFLFVGLAIRCQLVGTVKSVDAGIILAYSGIGAGLIGSAWATQDKFKVLSRVILGIGLLLQIFALILIRSVGII